jgi:hypothetical protein
MAKTGSLWLVIPFPTVCTIYSHQQFSDEFNMPGRTFFDEDDPFFQAVDLWYGVTMDKEVRDFLTRTKMLVSNPRYSGMIPML